MMSDPMTATGDGAVFDPHKRVHYTNGLVLGVDEFNQEQQYFLAQHRGQASQLHGYGTTCGLRVFTQKTGEDTNVVVEPGTAVLPSGRTVHVDKVQCAELQEWVERHEQDLADQTLPGSLSIYVVLGHRECATDLVPIPSAACRPQEESSVPSRIEESFELSLTLELPAAAERLGEQRLGRFLSWLRIIEAGKPVDVEDFFDRIRATAHSEPEAAPFGLPADLAESLLRAAFRVWITEVRPVLRALPPTGAAPDRLLLAELSATLDSDGQGGWVVSGTVDVDEDARPVLLPTALVTESAIPLTVTVAQLLALAPPMPVAAASAAATKRSAAPRKKTARAAPKKAPKAAPKKAGKAAKTSKTGRATRRRTKKSPPGGATES